MKNEQQSKNLLLKVDPRSTFRNNFLQPATMFLLRDKLITQGEKRETSTKTCNETMLRNKLKVFVSRISPPSSSGKPLWTRRRPTSFSWISLLPAGNEVGCMTLLAKWRRKRPIKVSWGRGGLIGYSFRYSQLPPCGHLILRKPRYYGYFIVFSLVIADTDQHLGIFAHISSLFFRFLRLSLSFLVDFRFFCPVSNFLEALFAVSLPWISSSSLFKLYSVLFRNADYCTSVQ